MFAGKGTKIPKSGALSFTLLGSGLTRKHLTRLEGTNTVAYSVHS
jgi:hypothetical protein